MLSATAEWTRVTCAGELEAWKDIYHELPRWEWICWGIYFGGCFAGIVVGFALMRAGI